ncbi:hypothetical protein BSPLISOX_839 [uncultured Gammaproteobacteria bacterium]|nr:hypothetical protein BSPLISOX_839 [uncultured Gammaproteobacteria bacterium]
MCFIRNNQVVALLVKLLAVQLRVVSKTALKLLQKQQKVTSLKKKPFKHQVVRLIILMLPINLPNPPIERSY